MVENGTDAWIGDKKIRCPARVGRGQCRGMLYYPGDGLAKDAVQCDNCGRIFLLRRDLRKEEGQ